MEWVIVKQDISDLKSEKVDQKKKKKKHYMMDNEWADFVENQKKEYKKNHPEK